jgi:hypothetical protein
VNLKELNAKKLAWEKEQKKKKFIEELGYEKKEEKTVGEIDKKDGNMSSVSSSISSGDEENDPNYKKNKEIEYANSGKRWEDTEEGKLYSVKQGKKIRRK